LYITSLQESERGVWSLMIYQCPFPSSPPPTQLLSFPILLFWISLIDLFCFVLRL
jgi:hypothetical protein